MYDAPQAKWENFLAQSVTPSYNSVHSLAKTVMLFSLCVIVPRSDVTGTKLENEMVNHARGWVTTPGTSRGCPTPARYVVADPRTYNTAVIRVKQFEFWVQWDLITVCIELLFNSKVSWTLAGFFWEFFAIFWFPIKLWVFLNYKVVRTYSTIKNPNILKTPLYYVLTFKFDNSWFHSNINYYHWKCELPNTHLLYC